MCARVCVRVSVCAYLSTEPQLGNFSWLSIHLVCLRACVCMYVCFACMCVYHKTPSIGRL